MKAAVERVFVFGSAIFAHREFPHGRLRAVIRDVFDDRKARPAVRAVYERVAVAAVARVKQLSEAFVACGDVGWDGGEIVAFRLHLPSRIREHNARDLDKNEPTGIHRGNILGWEQHLADRLDGKPVTIEVRMDSQSILYHTLFLFAGAFTAAVLTLVLLIWWTMRRGREEPVS